MRQHTVHTPYQVGEVHFYTTEINGELILFDAGPFTDEGLVSLRSQVDLSRLRYVFITHCHVDHYGLAPYLARHTNATILLPRRDAIMFQCREGRLFHIEKLLVEHGFTREEIDGFRSIVEDDKVFPAPPERFSVVEESDIPGKLGISWLSCPGHSQSDLVFRVGNYAVTGDVLLRNIFQTPLLDVDVDTFNGRFRNYDVYCSTIAELVKLRGSIILPGHRNSIDSVDDTIIFYVGKMMERAGQLSRYAGTGSLREIVARIYNGGMNNPFLVYLKGCEILFMLDFLAESQRLKSAMQDAGLFAPVADLYHQVTSSR
jgi:2,4-dienoyl-CoA reductase (NADPH2)